MDPDRTVQNIGSISKTIVATAMMQLWEKGKFQLDDDVNERLPFALRSPAHPGTPITYRLLLTHRSGIADSLAYRSSYACGDPSVPLDAWLRAYLNRAAATTTRKPTSIPGSRAQKSHYSNVGFGLLGYLVERVSGEPFPQYTRKKIFEPLGMKRTGWLLSEVDVAAHAVPYVPAADGDPPDEELEAYRKFGLLNGEASTTRSSGDHRPLCLYSFPNYPDGSLRTSVNQLARFLLAYVERRRLRRGADPRGRHRPAHADSAVRDLAGTGPLLGDRDAGRPAALGAQRQRSGHPDDHVVPAVGRPRGDRLRQPAGVDLCKINERLFQEATRI